MPALNTRWTRLLGEVAVLGLQMRDIQVPICPIGDEDVAIWSMGVGDFVDLHVSREDVYDNGIVQRDDASSESVTMYFYGKYSVAVSAMREN